MSYSGQIVCIAGLRGGGVLMSMCSIAPRLLAKTNAYIFFYLDVDRRLPLLYWGTVHISSRADPVLQYRQVTPVVVVV